MSLEIITGAAGSTDSSSTVAKPGTGKAGKAWFLALGSWIYVYMQFISYIYSMYIYVSYANCYKI